MSSSAVILTGAPRRRPGEVLQQCHRGRGAGVCLSAVTSDDTGIATVQVAGSVLTITGATVGDVDLLIVETVSGAHRVLRVQVRR